MTRFLVKAQTVLRNPVLRPVEIWLLRTALLALCTWLGIDISHLL